MGRPELSIDGQRLAVVVSCKRPAWLSYHSAGSFFDIHHDRVRGWDVSIQRGRGGIERTDDFRVHHLRTIRAEDVTVVRGIPITTVSRTLVDLAQVLDQDSLRRAVHEAEVTRQLNRSEVRSIIERMPTRRGVKRLAELLGTNAPDPTNSRFVARFLKFCEQRKIGPPETSVYIDAGFAKPTEIDVLFRDERLIVELDGRQVHLTQQRFESDRRRDVALLARGYETVRVTWRRLEEDDGTLAAELGAILAARRRLLVGTGYTRNTMETGTNEHDDRRPSGVGTD